MIQDRLLDFRSRCSLAAREIEHGDAEFLQVVVLPHPVVPDHEHVDVQFLDDLGMVQRLLRDDDVRELEGLNDGDPLLERDDGRILVARHQFVGAHADDERIAQSAGVLDHLQMIGMEHVECSGSIDDDSVVVHGYICAKYSV